MARTRMSVRWIALLRGVNVGGHAKISMPALRASCEAAGFTNVVSYIQSGNLVLDAADSEDGVADRVHAVIEDRHGLSVPVVVRSFDELAGVAERHPGAGGPIDPRFLHVQFLDGPADPHVVIDPAPFLPDTFTVDGRHVYVTYPDGSGRSKLTIDVFERAHRVRATARNLNTVRALVELAGRRS